MADHTSTDDAAAAEPWSFTRFHAVVIVATLAVFAPVCGHEFTTWDDQRQLAEHPWLMPPSLAGVAAAWTRADKGLYIPVTYTFWSMIAAVAQVSDAHGKLTLNPWAFHSANLLLHVLAALVVLSILRRLVRHDAAACVGALLFALHPVQVEPVAWASGTKDLLCGLFSLAALHEYLLATSPQPPAPPAPRGRRGWRYAAATAAFILAMLSKPAAVVAPVIAAAVDFLIVRRPPRQVLKSIVPWLILAIPCIVWTRAAQPPLGVAATPLWTRPFLAAHALTFYLYKLLLPVRLGIDYGQTPSAVIKSHWALLTPLVPLVLAWLILLYRTGRRWLGAAGIILVAALAPVLGFVPFQFQAFSTVADHYLYLAMLGPALALAWAAARWWVQVAYACIVILVALGVRSSLQVQAWKDTETLYRHSLAVNPNSPRLHNNLGAWLWRQGKIDEAAQHYQQALALDPDFIQARDNLILTLFVRQRYDEVIEQLTQTIRLKKSLPPELAGPVIGDQVALARTCLKIGKPAEAIAVLELIPPEQRDDSARQALAEARSMLPPSRPATTAP